MAEKIYFNGLGGVVVGSITGIVLVHRFGWNQWWQIVGAIIVGGLIGLTAADPKWVLGKLAQSYKNFFPKEEDAPAPEKKKISAAQFFFNASVTARWILTFASVFILMLAPAAAKIMFHVNVSDVGFAPNDLAILPFVLLIGLLLAFFLTPLFDQENFLNQKYWNKSKLHCNGRSHVDTQDLAEYYGFWGAEKQMLLIGVYSTFRVLLLYVQIALFIPANIFFLLVAAVYLLREIAKSARHLLIFLSINLSIIVATCCSSLIPALIWGLLSGVLFYHVSFKLSRLPFVKFTKAYRGYSIIWCWKLS